MTNPPDNGTEVHEGGEGLPERRQDAQLIREFLNQQSAQIEIRRQELAIQQQEVTTGHEYALQALQAQAKDRSQVREEKRKERRDRMWFGVLIVVLLGAFVWYALSLGKDALAQEILKDLVLLVAGGLGGYSIGTRKRSREEATEPDEE